MTLAVRQPRLEFRVLKRTLLQIFRYTMLTSRMVVSVVTKLYKRQKTREKLGVGNAPNTQ